MKSLYALLLRLFPRSYREEYGDELQAVFNLSLDDAMNSGLMDAVRVVLRELFSLPAAILYEHLRERRNSRMIGNFDSKLNFAPGSRSELFAFFIPFIVTMGLFTFGSLLPPMVGSIIRLSMLGVMFVLFVVGLTKGLPRWFLPYLGFVLAIVNIFATDGLIDPKWRGFSFPFHVSRFVRDFIQGGVFWVGIIILLFLFIVLVTLIPKFRPFYKRLRNDWTLLAFILYGTAPFAILLTFDDYQDAGLYLFMSFLILAIGGWLYLLSNVSWKKFMFLFTGLTLSMGVATVGAAVLIESSLYGPYSTWQNAMEDPIRTWMYLAIFLLLPLAINLLPRGNKTEVTGVHLL